VLDRSGRLIGLLTQGAARGPADTSDRQGLRQSAGGAEPSA
jgi:hypothetical protein